MSDDEPIEVPEIIPLEGFEVAAIPGKGVWIVDQDGNGWHVAGPNDRYTEDNRLVAAYRRAVEDE